jgi:hypothetical protein
MLRFPLSLVLTCLAVLALLTNPVAAAAAQADCAQTVPAAMDDMAGMATTPMAGHDRAQAQKAAGPCCDQTTPHRPGRDCAQICAISCAVVAALPATPLTVSLVSMRVTNVPRPDVSGFTHDPAGFERPPKSIL